jgi:hypothetical protein
VLAGCWYCNVPTKMFTLPEGRVKRGHIYKVEDFTLHQVTDDYFKQGAAASWFMCNDNDILHTQCAHVLSRSNGKLSD